MSSKPNTGKGAGTKGQDSSRDLRHPGKASKAVQDKKKHNKPNQETQGRKDNQHNQDRRDKDNKGNRKDRNKDQPRGLKATPSRSSSERPSLTGPIGQRLYDMPYSAPAPRLINPEIGLHNLVSRAGHNAGYTIDVTLLDAPDHRLIRSGVLLAHRVLDGRGEWYLGAPEWQPTLPAERVEPMSQADLPQEFADLIRPFRRRATLGPVAALTCERREFALRDDRGTTLALLRDDKVTVRRGGLTTARYREVMVTPLDNGLSDEQAAHLARVLDNAGATQVSRFPRLVTRLGAPATGPSDFPLPQPLEADVSFAQFVSHLLASRLRGILSADLAIRTQFGSGSAELAARAGQLRLELHGLSSVVDVGWLEDLDEELDWIVGQAQQAGPTSGEERRSKVDLGGRLRGERYLTLLDRLVTAARAPQLGNASALRATEVLGSLINDAQGAVVRASSSLTVDSPNQDWAMTSRTYEELFRITGVGLHLLPERVERLRHQLGMATQLLAEAAKHSQTAEHNRELASRSSADEAFALGRAYEHELAVATLAREAFVRRWAKTARKLS